MAAIFVHRSTWSLVLGLHLALEDAHVLVDLFPTRRAVELAPGLLRDVELLHRVLARLLSGSTARRAASIDGAGLSPTFSP